MPELVPDLISAAVLLLVPGLVVLYVLRRERTRYQERTLLPDAAVVRARCAGCGASLAATGLLYVRDGTLVCADCRRCFGGAELRNLSGSELARLIDAPGQRTQRGSSRGEGGPAG